MSATALLHERTRELTARYERHAYLVYNIALRTTCEEEPAALAAERAFLTAADDEALVGAAARAALEEAPAQPACDGAGDEQAAALLRATSALAPVERAALALTDLAEASAGEVAEGAGPRSRNRRRRPRARPRGGARRRDARRLAVGAPARRRLGARLQPLPRRDRTRPARAHRVMPAAAPARRRRRRWPLLVALLVAAVAGALYGTGIGSGGAQEAARRATRAAARRPRRALPPP